MINEQWQPILDTAITIGIWFAGAFAATVIAKATVDGVRSWIRLTK